MSKLIQRKKPIWDKNSLFCPDCQSLLKETVNKKYQGFTYCSKCKNWYLIEVIQRHINRHKVAKIRYFGPGTTEQLRKKMDRYIQQFQEEHISKVKIYTSPEYDQEFLKSLIPKK